MRELIWRTHEEYEVYNATSKDSQKDEESKSDDTPSIQEDPKDTNEDDDIVVENAIMEVVIEQKRQQEEEEDWKEVPMRPVNDENSAQESEVSVLGGLIKTAADVMNKLI